MKQPPWKILLSHFKDVHIESTSSDYNEILDLLLVKGSYQLCTAEAVYSYAEKYDNFYDSFNEINFEKQKIKNVLILGLGLGSIPYMLENHFGSKYNYTAVEIDSEVIYLASKYVLDDLQSEMQIIETDAYIFLSTTMEQYDMICMDVFDSDTIPEIFESINFLELLKASLSQNGILLYNRLYLTEEDKIKTNTFYDEAFSSVFNKSSYLELRANKMLINKSL